MQPDRTESETNPPDLLPERADDGHLARFEWAVRGGRADEGLDVLGDESDLGLVVEAGAFVDGEVVATDALEEDGEAGVGEAAPVVQRRVVGGGRSVGFESLVVELRGEQESARVKTDGLDDSPEWKEA